MSKSNIQIVHDFIEIVLNQKQFDQAYTYLARDCVSHTPPYIGTGLSFDDSNGTEIRIIETSPNGPADGRLLPGDVVTRVTDGDKTWGTFEELRDAVWPLGVAGTTITVTVRRDGELLEVPITRGRVEAFDLDIANYLDLWREYTLKDWPDLQTEVRMILGSDDLVSCYLVNSGNNQQYQRFAVWSEFDLYRLKDGLIVEMWSLEDNLRRLTQLGYQVKEPSKAST